MVDLKVAKAVIQYSRVRFYHIDRPERRVKIRTTVTKLMQAEKRRRGIFVRDVKTFLKANKVKIRF